MRSFSHRLLTGAALIAALVSSSCLLVVDPEDYRSDPLLGGSAPTSTGSGGAGAGAGPVTGGSGGAPMCEGVDLQNDAANCGSCGFVCEQAQCVAGVCGGEITLDGGDIYSIAVADGVLYLVQRDLDDGSGGSGEGGAPVAAALDRGMIRTLPLDFTSTTKPGVGHPVENVVSGFAVGTFGAKHVYFSGQNLQGALETTLQACAPSGCVDVDIRTLTVQVQSIEPVNTTMYMALVGNTVVSLPINPITGLPELPEATLITSYEPPIPVEPANGGLSQVSYTAVPEPALLTASYDYNGDATPTGAIFRAPLSELPLLGGGDSATQWGPTFIAQGFLVAPNGAVYAHDQQSPTPQLLKIEGVPPTTSVFVSNAGARRALDDDFVYVSSTGNPQVIRVFAQDGSGEVAQSPAPPAGAQPIQWIDARHPEYVFYLRFASNTIYRWPKPVR